jgi:methylmalonyl-CoA/ethylmalonyl-CoA epimerase
MPNVFIDHVSMCVRDLELAIADWSDILNVLSPGHANNMTRGASSGDGVDMIWATFQNPDPQGVSIQLWAPAAKGSWVDKVLAKRGEFVHHIAFLSDDFGHTVQECRDAGLPVLLDESTAPSTMPWLLWNFIPEDKAHGVLIELATRYQAVGDRWYPHPGNVENKHLLDESRDKYYPGE